MKIEELLHHARASMGPFEAFRTLIRISSRLRLGADDWQMDDSSLRLKDPTLLPILEGASRALLSARAEDRYSPIMSYLDAIVGGWGFDGWIRSESSAQIVGLIGDAKTVRFSHGASFRPCLDYAFGFAISCESRKASFCAIGRDLCELMRDLAVVLDLSHIISTEENWPWDRLGDQDFEVEVVFPPFNHAVQSVAGIDQRVLSTLGLEEGRQGRLNAESVSVADALKNARGRVILSVADGELFRMVGAEPIGRRALLDSGRLQGILAVPSGMMFVSTWIRTNVVILSPAGEPSESVRFVDLGHDLVALKGRRGRHEVKPGVEWISILSGAEASDQTFARDVGREEILENNTVLVPDRYLNVGARDRIAILLEQSDVVRLEDVFDLVRPITISSDDEGDYVLLEAAPSDVNERGLVGLPRRELKVDRTKYNKAFNQQLRPGDLVFSIKGTVGVVGIVPNEVPKEGEQRVWTAGQSLMILRPKRRTGISSQAAYEYLTNDIVQDFIKSLAGGAAIQSIATKDLKEFSIPLPDAETVTSIEAKFAERQAIFDQIDDLKNKLEDVRRAGWPHALLDRKT